jgi:hypothetical protein
MFRRLLAGVAVGALFVTGLAGCRADRNVAAYVGDTQITEARVDTVMGSIRDAAPAEAHGEIRGRVVEMLVLTEAGTSYAETAGVQIPEPTPEEFAGQLGLPADNAYVQVVAGFLPVLNTINAQAQSTAPSEADQREVYDNLLFNGEPVQDPFEEVQQFFTQEAIGTAIGTRDLLTQVVADGDVTINPRYRLVHQVQVTIGQAQSWLGVPLGRPSPVVDES